MAKLLKLRRGTTSQHSSFTGAEGEVTVDTDKETLVVHDGSTAGGHPVAAQDMANVPAGTILGTQLENSGVSAGQYGSSSAIPIVTVDAQGLVTAASTTAIDSTTIANGTSNVAVANNGNITATRSGTARLVVDDAGVDVTGNITSTGSITSGGNVDIPQGSLLRFGGTDAFIQQASNYLQIKETESDNLYIDSNFVYLRDTSANTKFNTTSTGVQVTGTITGTSTAAITGAVTCGGLISNSNVTIENDSPSLTLNDSNSENDFRITNSHGTFIIHDNDAGATRMSLTSAGQFTFATNVDFSSGIDVTGDIVATGDIKAQGNDIRIEGSQPGLHLTDTNNNDDFLIYNNNGILKIYDSTDGADRVAIHSSGDITVVNNLDVGQGLDVTGNITVTGTVDGRDVASDGSKLDGIESGATADQSASEILTLIKTVDGSGSGLDADTLDGIDQGSFLRSDSGDTANGDITFGGGAGAITIGGNSDIRFNTGSWTGNSTKIQHHSNYLYIQSDQSGIILRGPTSDRWIVDGSGHFVPSGNNTYNIGNTSNRVANIYVNDFHLSNKGHSNEMDGTWGDWTIQEGESDLFLKNNRSGKKYKFNLTEVS